MPTPTDRLLTRARERFALGDYYGAAQLAEETVDAGADYADVHHLRGVALALLGQPAAALAAFDAALALNPRYFDALMHRGLLLADLGRTDEAAFAFRRAAAENDGQVAGLPRQTAARLANLHAALGEEYATAGAYGRAVDEYRRALELGPGFLDLRYRLGRHLLAAGRYLEAQDELKRVLEAHPQLVAARVALGLARYLAGDVAGARDVWRGCREELPDDARLDAYLAMVDRVPL